MQFYSGNLKTSRYNEPIASPYIRCLLNCDSERKLILKIAVVGVYQLYFNGKKITKGLIAPYRANPNHFVYIDTYTIDALPGKNIIGITLGNGIAASQANVWSFDKFRWSSAPKFAISVLDNDVEILNGENAKWMDSHVLYNDWHGGETIDFNKVIKNWNQIDFDDTNWNQVERVDSPKGEIVNIDYDPVKFVSKVKYIKKIYLKNDNRIIFDFGKSLSGIYVAKVKGKKNQKITIQCSDALIQNKTLHLKNINLCGPDRDFTKAQKDVVILSGEVNEIQNQFSFKGFRFLQIDNVDDLEIIEIFVYEISSAFVNAGTFKCDNKIINRLQQCVINSDRSNFIFYPLDCPQREKNGWTGDAVLSAEQFMLNFDVADQYKNWLRNIVKAQTNKGNLPGIVPTDTWGYEWGAGPGWDNILFEGSYRSYVYSGDVEILEIIHDALVKYLKYMKSKENNDGCFEYGLEDWLPINTHTPLWVTDTLQCLSMCMTASKIFKILGDTDNYLFAQQFANKIKKSYIIKFDREYKENNSLTQTQISLMFQLGLINKLQAKEMLYKILIKTNNTIDCGALGSRYLFRTLSDIGEHNLSLELITQNKYPSYKTGVLDVGLKTLPECFLGADLDITNFDDESETSYYSLNHHFWGDISAFFYRYIAGIKIDDVNVVNFSPLFFDKVNNVHATHKFKSGVFEVKIVKFLKSFYCKVNVPEDIKTNLIVPDGYKCNVDSLHQNINKIKFTKIR